MKNQRDQRQIVNEHQRSASKIVVKIGGSLMTRRDLGPAVADWLNDRYRGTQVNLVVGGGAIIDGFRQLDAIHHLDPVELHWQCVAALRQTNQLVSRLIPDCIVIGDRESYNRHRISYTPGRFVIIPDTFYHRTSGDDLPCDWTTTADSIAGLLFKKLNADRLLIFKSCAIPAGIDVGDAASRGIIDSVLPSIIKSDRIELIHLP
jgi:aspartokinase-like uncharacterized kinase